MARARIVLCGLLCTACVLPVRAPVRPAVASAFARYRAPITVDLHQTPVGSKHGESGSFYVQDPLITGLSFAFGNASAASAMQDGGITELHHLDYEVMSVLGVFVRFKLHAYGD